MFVGALAQLFWDVACLPCFGEGTKDVLVMGTALTPFFCDGGEVLVAEDERLRSRFLQSFQRGTGSIFVHDKKRLSCFVVAFSEFPG